MVLDTNEKYKDHTCQYAGIFERERCQLISSFKITVLAKYEEYNDPVYLKDMEKKNDLGFTGYQTLLD